MAGNVFDWTLRGHADITDIESAIKKIKSSVDGADISTAFSKQFSTIFKNLTESSIKLKEALKPTNKDEFANMLKQATAVGTQYTNLVARIQSVSQKSDKELREFLPKDLVKQISAANAALKNYEKQTDEISSKIQKNKNNVVDWRNELNKVRAQLKEKQSSVLSTDEQAQVQTELLKTKNTIEAINREMKKFAPDEQNTEDYQKLNNQLAEATRNAADLNSQLEQSKQAKKDVDDLTKSESSLNDKIEAANKANSELNANRLGAFQTLRKTLKELGIDVSDTKLKFEDFEEIVKTLETSGIEGVKQKLLELEAAAKEEAAAFDKLGKATAETREEYEQYKKSLSASEELKNKVKQFFTAANAVQLFRRAIQNSFNTIKELDAVMTETAVVTDFSVGDMWNQLPEYTERANKLGVAIKDVYQASTLYYQQGLKTNEVVGVANQTLKMARIAGLGAEDATNKMTAALRGFNMEVNEVNAERISDVYSKLAAITASNVEEISSAMTKTASIAASAGMQFETTAAFLSQIIETTRESAETAGTALKTVIARFQELKKSPEEIGEVDGEVVDANKIETALKSVGVALRDSSGQFRELDEVFMELASKWDTLDKNTQRYIATIAAGSRQQSRFLAMMSNYARTQELVTAANNAAGAATTQYEKTLESLQTKLNKLKNAWDEFTMSITDNKVIKIGVDLLTQLIQAINKLTSTLPGPLNGLSKFGLAFGAFKVGGKWFNEFSIAVKQKGVGAIDALKQATTTTFSGVKKLFDKKMWNFDPIKQGGEAFNTLSSALQSTSIEATEAAIKQAGLTVQTELYNSAIAAGLPEKEAQLLLTTSEAEATELLKLAESNLTNEQYKQILAEAALHKQQEAGIITKTKAVMALIFGTGATKANAMATLGLVSAEEAKALADGTAETAQWGFNAALYACPLSWILGIILAVVAAVTLLAVALYNASDAAQMKNLQKEIEGLNEQINEAKDNLDSLIDTKTELQELTDEFNALTKGTKEWKQYLLKANQVVLNLLEKYPLLKQFLSTTEDGLITVDPKGWEALEDQLTTEMSVVQGQAAIAEIQLQSLKDQEIIRDALSSYTRKVYVANTNGEAGGHYVTRHLNQSTIEAYINKTLDQKVIDLWGEDTLKAAAGSLEGAKAQIQANKAPFQATLMSTVLTQTDASKKEYSNFISEVVSANYEDSIKGIHKKAVKDAWLKIFSKEDLKDLGAALNLRDANGNIRAATYGEMRKYSPWSDTKARETLERYRTQQKMIQDTKTLDATLSNTSNRGLDLIARLTDGGKGLRRVDIGNLKGTKGLQDLSEQDINEFLKPFGLSLEALKMSLSQFVEYFQLAENRFDNATKLIKQDMEKDLFNGLTSEQTAALATHFRDIILTSGSGAANALNDLLTNILSSLSQEEAEQFVDSLNLIDWKDASAWDSLKDTLAENNINVSSTLLDQFTTSAKSAAQAVKKIDFTKLNGQINSLAEILNSINRGEAGRTFSKDIMDQLLEVNPNLQFSVSLIEDEYYYIGTMEDLNRTLQILDGDLTDVQKQLKTKITAGELLMSGNYDDLLNYTSKEGQNGFSLATKTLGNFIQAMSNHGANLVDIGLSKDFQYDKVTAQELDAIIERLSTYIYSGYQKNLEDYNASRQESVTKLGLDKRITQIAAEDWYNNGEFSEAIEKAIFGTAISAGVSEVLINEATKAKDLFYETAKTTSKSSEEYKEAYANYQKYLQLLANTTSITQNNKKLQELLTTVHDLVEQYEQSEDAKSRFSLASQMGSLFGIDVSKINGAEGGAFVDNMAKLIEGNEAAYLQIIKTALSQSGIVVSDEFTKGLDQANAWIANNLKTNPQLKTLLETWANQNKNVVAEAFGDEEIFRVFTAQELIDAVTGGGTSRNDWENPYTWLYNMNEKINDQIRERDKWERKYNRILDDRYGTVEQLVEKSKQEIDALQQQARYEEQRIGWAKQEIQELMDDSRYSQWGAQGLYTYDEATGTISVNQEKVDEKIGKDPYFGEAFEKFIARLVELRDVAEESDKDLDEIYSQVKELRLRGRDQYIDMENRVLDALVKHYQEEIDTLQTIGDTIHDTNNKLISEMQESISKIRQDRANAEKEQSIQDKQTRLAYLQMDTSGANATEILKLQQEIDKEQESYTDILIDQAIQEMTDANEKAYEQRQEQIEIMNNQLQYAQDAGMLWDTIADMILTQVNNDGTIIAGTWLDNILKNGEGWASFSETSKQKWAEELQKSLKEAKIWEGQTLIDYMNQKINDANEQPKVQDYFDKKNSHGRNLNEEVEAFHEGWDIWANKKIPDTTGSEFHLDLTGMDRNTKQAILRDVEFHPYATGGLADYTGPAWLDGTPSAPELVLNAKDTQNFLALRDILSQMSTSESSIAGDNYYDINIEVDALHSDYDVEQLAGKIKSMIVDDATYRNVNTVNRLR